MTEAKLNDGSRLSPLHEFIVIEPKDAFESSGTIALPEAYDDDTTATDGDLIRTYNQTCLGTVKAVGTGRVRWGEDCVHWRDLPDVAVGDSIVYHRASALRLDDSDLVLAHVNAILLVVESDVRQVLGGLETK